MYVRSEIHRIQHNEKKQNLKKEEELKYNNTNTRNEKKQNLKTERKKKEKC